MLSLLVVIPQESASVAAVASVVAVASAAVVAVVAVVVVARSPTTHQKTVISTESGALCRWSGETCFSTHTSSSPIPPLLLLRRPLLLPFEMGPCSNPNIKIIAEQSPKGEATGFCHPAATPSNEKKQK